MIREDGDRFRKDTPCFARFDSALVESRSKSPSTTAGIAFSSMVYIPYQVNGPPTG